MKRKRGTGTEARANRMGYAFMTPWILGFALFTAFPFAATIYLSFSDVTATIAGFEVSLSGLSNYDVAFFKNAEFMPALAEFASTLVPRVLVVLVVSFLIAYLLGRISRGRSLLRTIYFLPVIIMSGPVLSQIISSDTVVRGQEVGSDVSSLFIMSVLFNFSPFLAEMMYDVFDSMSSILWFTGIPIVLFINALQKINPSIYEAARIDAANEWQILWKITLPQLRSVALVCAIFTITQLGTNDTNAVYTLIQTATGNLSNGLGLAATYAWLYSLAVIVFIGIAFLVLREPKNRGEASA